MKVQMLGNLAAILMLLTARPAPAASVRLMEVTAPAGEHRPDEVIGRALSSRGATDVRFIDGRRVSPKAGFTQAGEYEVVCTLDGQSFHGQIVCNLRSDTDAPQATLTLTTAEPTDLADVR